MVTGTATALPTGTVTFLFTDIEGSTRLVQRLGPDYRDVLATHAAVIRERVASGGGIEVSTEGDSFFCVFTSAVDAVRTAAAIQTALADVPWPETGAVRVRIGVHTGEGEIGGDNYSGIDVHRAARISAAGHGGQVLVSAETHMLAVVGGFDFIDLGTHELKDLEAPQRIYQVAVSGLAAEFPPLRTASARSHNLPAMATPLIGRADDAQMIAALLARQRLITITGPGGLGKTRLALHVGGEVLERFTAGVYAVDLAPLDDPDLVTAAIAAVLDVADATTGGLAAWIGGRELLLILDNFEHVAAAAPVVADLLAAASGLRVLATSQRPLRIAGEHLVPLRPLRFDASSDDELAPAMQLFADRAGAADPSFQLTDYETDVRSLVVALEGVPLAIELAAAWASFLTPAQILERVRGRDDVLTSRRSDVDDRHRSLRSAMASGLDLLDTAQRTGLRRLSVFSGGMSLDAAEAVVGDGVDALSAMADLVDRSLIHRSLSDLSGSRFRMLEAIRVFASEELAAAGEVDRVTARHTGFFFAMAAEAARELEGERLPLWLAKLSEDWENLRAVLSRLHASSDARRGLAMIGSIWRFMQGRGRINEALLWLDRFFALPGAGERTPERARGLMAQAALRYWTGDAGLAIGDYEEAVAIARENAETTLAADALYGLATSRILSRKFDDVAAPLEEAKRLYTAAGDSIGLAHIAGAQAFAAFRKEGPSPARDSLERSVQLYREVGHRVYAAQIILALVGVALHEGRLRDAVGLGLEATELADEVGDEFLQVWSLEWMAAALVELGDIETALRLVGGAESARERIGGGWTPLSVNLDDARTRAARVVGEAAVAAGVARGRGLPLASAVELARTAASGLDGSPTPS